MPPPFVPLTIDEFADLLGQFPFSRRIDTIHLHHTWRPNHAQFRANPGVASIEAMYRYHTQTLGWQDIAQHITIDPDGKLWTGRGWNRPPASATGFNGNLAAGPFMIEMIGDFDQGRDPFAGEQKNAALAALAHLLARHSLTSAAVRFHNQMSSKTCPGSAIDRAALLTELQATLDALAAPSAPRAFSDAESKLRQNSLHLLAQWQTREALAIGRPGTETEPEEETMTANSLTDLFEGPGSPTRALFPNPFGRKDEFTPEQKQTLRRHAVNLRLGAFLPTGSFATAPEDVDRIFTELLPAEHHDRQNEHQPLRLVFYAHGGLTSESDSLRSVLARLAFWRQNNVYPVFFCWETGLMETLEDIIKSLLPGQRGFLSDAADAILEFVARPAGRAVWGQMKRSAELASLPGGGAERVAIRTRELWNRLGGQMEIHAIGHSAGAIFLAHFLPVLLAQPAAEGVPPITIQSLHLLAPAATNDLFTAALLPRIGPGKPIAAHTLYTMNQDLEQRDHAGPYQKSLLYLVSRSFEDLQPAPILGLEESLRQSQPLRSFYGLDGALNPPARILFSQTPPTAAPDAATAATAHGDFDNDAPTMNTVMRQILRQPAANIVGFSEQPPPVRAFRRATAATASRGESGRRRALCIGIDEYPGPNALAGCVNDAREWAAALTSLGFSVTSLLNQQATHRTILDSLQELIESASPGDVIVFQFSGHGTQVKDLDGDEATGLDQALVPVDFNSGAFVIDDELRALTSRIGAGVNLTCFMDCCHSGTNTRLFGPTPVLTGGSRARFLPLNAALADAHLAFRAGRRAPAAIPRGPADMKEVSFAACQSHEVAYETQGSGDFTKRALTILRGGITGLTHDSFHTQVIGAFGATPRQRPLLDCADDARTRGLLAALLGSPAAPIAADPAQAILDRLDSIERRLTNLGG